VLHVWIATRIARRLVPLEVAHWAALFTALFGASCWIGAQHARTAFLESWSALALAGATLSYLRALEKRRTRDAILLGAVATAALLVKWTHGIQLVACLGAAGLLDVVLAHGADRKALARTLAWSLLPPALVFLWWFVVPWPGDPDLGHAHRVSLFVYLTKASSLEGLRVVDLAIVLPLMACISMPACALQLAGLCAGVLRWRERAWRICALVALAGIAGFVAYPYRIERFVIPTLFPLWALGGALGARLVARAPIARRAWFATLGVAFVLATAGVGSISITHAVRGRPINETEREAIAAAVRAWRRPFAHARAPAAGPEGVQRTLDFASQHVDGSARFGWIGGSCTEIPMTLVRWRLFQERFVRTDLAWDPEPIDTLWSDPGWTEADFRAWAQGFAQLVVLDPPDPRERRARNFERVYPEWAARMPGWMRIAHFEVGFGLDRIHQVAVYARAN
jgi:hypothetical protein